MPIRIITRLAWLCAGLSASSVFAQTRAPSSTATSQAAPSGTTGTSTAAAATGNNAAGGGQSSASVSGGINAVPFSTGNQPQLNAADGTLGDQVGQNAFVGQGNNAFVGSRNAGQNAGASLTPQFNQMNNSNPQGNGGNTGNSNVKRARPQQRIAFTYPKANLAQTRIDISARFQRLAAVSGADTTISDAGIATLTGTVADDDSRKLAEALTRLEPGVRSVVNELKVETVSP